MPAKIVKTPELETGHSIWKTTYVTNWTLSYPNSLPLDFANFYLHRAISMSLSAS